MVGPSGTYYFLTDANYNVTAVLNSSGAVIERYVYSAYGTATVYSPDYSTTYSASTVGNTVLFAGMWVDPTTGLARTSSRWYNTVLNTFMTSDPAQQGTNWYEYSGDDPADETDPTGLGGEGDEPGGQSFTAPSFPCNSGSTGSLSEVSQILDTALAGPAAIAALPHARVTRSQSPTIRRAKPLRATMVPEAICMPTTAAR